MSVIIDILKAVAVIIQALPLLAKLKKSFGPNWHEALSKITDANQKIQDAKTPEEEDEAIKALAIALNRKR